MEQASLDTHLKQASEPLASIVVAHPLPEGQKLGLRVSAGCAER
jgi:hypothetical protein